MAQKGKPTKPSTLAMDRSRIESQVKPLLGERAVHSLTLDGSKGMQADIATGRWTSPLGDAAGEFVGMLGTGRQSGRRGRNALS